MKQITFLFLLSAFLENPHKLIANGNQKQTQHSLTRNCSEDHFAIQINGTNGDMPHIVPSRTALSYKKAVAGTVLSAAVITTLIASQWSFQPNKQDFICFLFQCML